MDNSKKATIFLNCLQNCQKQASFKQGKLLSLEELEEQGVLENIVIPFSGVGYTNPQMALIKNEVYLYAKIKGSTIPQPIDIIPQDFMLTYLDKGYFKVNDTEIPFDYNGMETSNFDISKEQENLSFAKEIVKVLNMLGCTDDIDINDMSDEDWRNLNRLITAFLEKKPVKGLKEDLPPVTCFKVGKLKFAIYLKQCEEKGTYEIFDFFKTDFSVVFEDSNNTGKMLPISQFSIL